jgi:hypothetical protein
MAFSYTVTDLVRGVGRKKVAFGTFTNGAATDSGGTIITGLKKIDAFSFTVGSHIGTEGIKVSLNSSVDGSVALVTSTGAVTGTWEAIGN